MSIIPSTGVRLYGVSIGHGSFARVTAGMRGALERLGLLAGFVPLDTYDEEGGYIGHDAPVAVFVGPPPQIGMTRSVGWHTKRWMLLPPNSSWVPTDMLEFVSKHATGLVAPSKWAEGVLLAHCAKYELEVSVWRHGVAPELTRDEETHAQRRDEYGQGRFRVLHMASTARERKGTAELISGWAAAVRRGVLGSDPMLRIMVEDFSGKYEELAEKEATWDKGVTRSIEWLPPRKNMDLSATRTFFQQHHLVAQPSRGEGFGMVPLEARACGVPIVATNCTGHGDHVREGDPGVIVVPCGKDEPIDDGPGALAPSVHARDVEFALEDAYCRWPQLEEAAFQYAPTLASEWSWDRVTEQWLQSYRILEKTS
jgi:glycosyltransferase involved in cell wall biosynthesis